MISRSIEQIHKMIGGSLCLGECSLNTLIEGVTIDSRNINKGNIFIAIRGQKMDGHKFVEDAFGLGAKLAIIQDEKFRSDKIATILVDDTIKTLQLLAEQYRSQLHAKIIAITGSNGKTSCKDLMASALSSKFKVVKTQGNQNNELGVPLTLLRIAENTDIAVIEMGVERIGDIHFLNDIVKPDIGILVSIAHAHIVHLKSIENVAKAKLELLDGLSANGLFLMNGDDSIIESEFKKKSVVAKVLRFGYNTINDMYLTDFKQEGMNITFKTNQSDFQFTINTLGKHQAFNALSVIQCSYYLGLSDSEIQNGWNDYTPSSMRNDSFVINKMRVLDDSYKSNPQSVAAALATFHDIDSNYKIILLGDMLDLGDNEILLHEQLANDILKYEFNELLVYGDLISSTLETTSRLATNKKYMHFDTHDEIYEYLKPYLNKECALLVKGSRGMQLDIVVRKLRDNMDSMF